MRQFILPGGGGFSQEEQCAMHVADGVLHDIVNARPAARAYPVERTGCRMHETPIVPRRID
jgi:hypothetical protein